MTFQKLLRDLSYFWEKQGCVIQQGYDLEVGAGTFNPATFLRSLGPEPFKAAYIEPSRRPTDGRYGTNPNRLQHYFQYQVILKPSPSDIQRVYLESLEAIGLNLAEHDIRFVHDDWESPTLGAWGLGWEVWVDGSEVSQITYFQSVAGINVRPVCGEITYGLERLAKYIQKVPSMFDLKWNDTVTYGDIYLQNEKEWSGYNFDQANTEMWFRHFDDYEREAKKLMALNLPIPAYDFVIKSSHAFNLLDARGAISVTERTGYIGRIRELAKQIAESYMKSREEQGFPLMNSFPDPAAKHQEKSEDSSLSIPQIEKDDFLIEIGSEELPATFVPIGLANLEKNLQQLLEKEGIPYKSIKTFGTPRRLTAIVEDMEGFIPEQSSEKKGPPLSTLYDDAGNPKPTASGFFKSIGLSETPTLAEVKQRKAEFQIKDLKSIDYLYATIKSAKKDTVEILQQHLPKLITSIDFPKKMRWADLDITYARPILWVAALLGKYTIPFTVGNVSSGNYTFGHRQLAPQKIVIDHPKHYVEILKKHFVMVDIQERHQNIVDQLNQLEKEIDGKIIERERVIPQVINLVEWPQITHAEFDADYLKAPKEILISEMVEHQKYFPVSKKDGSLTNQFVITANNTPSDQIREGNCIVLSARLVDGVFLYQQDLKMPLKQFNEKLKNVMFQKDLGSVYDKVERITKHAKIINQELKIADSALVEEAANLSKADLATAVVYEFPELQGIMGNYYAKAQGSNPQVAQAIEEHWMPKGENSPLPQSDVGVVLSLADKFDNLLGCFMVGLKPTSSSDPYALRRQVLGMIRILINGKLRLPLKETLSKCFEHFPTNVKKNKQTILEEIEAFIVSRIKTVFLDYGFQKDEIEASISYGVEDIYDTYLRIHALHQFRKTQEFQKLYEVYKRAKGQLQTKNESLFQKDLLHESAEIELYHSLENTSLKFSPHINAGQYDEAYLLIAKLQPPLAKLFEEVKILDDNPNVRGNRLALLQDVFKLFGQLLDFSKLQS